MALMQPKEFIQTVLINEVGDIHKRYPYISFAIMAIGIEFLGKCLNEYEDWNESNRSKKDFELAIDNLESFRRYRSLLVDYTLWTSLRNGFLHAFSPKSTITVSSKEETPHLVIVAPGRINLKCEDFYVDFKSACEEVIKMETFNSLKMTQPMLEVPSYPTENFSVTGSTLRS